MVVVTSLDFSLDFLLVEKEHQCIWPPPAHTWQEATPAEGREEGLSSQPGRKAHSHTHTCIQIPHTQTNIHPNTLIQSGAQTLIPSDFYSLLVLI